MVSTSETTRSSPGVWRRATRARTRRSATERRMIVVEFLGHKDALSADRMDVADPLERASSEDLLCDVKATVVEPLDGPALARLATEARSDPGFFDLDEDGSPLGTYDD
jgi:hypothetical protein